MCIMFRDKWIIPFFKFPFCGGFSLHLHKMVEEISRNITRAGNFKPPETSTWATHVCSTQSPNLVNNISYFPQVGLCEAPGGMSR